MTTITIKRFVNWTSPSMIYAAASYCVNNDAKVITALIIINYRELLFGNLIILMILVFFVLKGMFLFMINF